MWRGLPHHTEANFTMNSCVPSHQMAFELRFVFFNRVSVRSFRISMVTIGDCPGIGRRCGPSRNVFLRSCTDRDFCCHGAVPASNHCKKNDMWQPMLGSHPPPARKRVLLFRTWSMSLWRRPDFPHETVATPSPGLCLRPHPNLWHESAHKIIEEYQSLQRRP